MGYRHYITNSAASSFLNEDDWDCTIDSLPLSVQQLNALNVATCCLTSLSITSFSLKITVCSGLAVTVKVRTHMIVQLNRTEIN